MELINEVYQQFKSKDLEVSTDTRKLDDKSIFIALKGENFNGNTFAKDALEKDAAWVVVDEIHDVDKNHPKIILVENALSFLQDLAQFHRKQCQATIIGLTGSNGKTTNKELLYSVLSTQFKVLATEGNLNNHIGVPLTLLKLKDYHEFGIIEMGANHQKEIALLASIASPDYGFITNFGKAHLEGFGGIEGVIKGKSELYDFLKSSGGTVFVNGNDPLQIQQSQGCKQILFNPNKNKENGVLITANPSIELLYFDHNIHSELMGTYNFNNICTALAVGRHFMVEVKNQIKGIETYRPDNNRSQLIELGNLKVMMDAYNANPSSMSKAIEAFDLSHTDIPKYIILGDMRELGSYSTEEHKKVIEQCQGLNLEKVWLVGTEFEKALASFNKEPKNIELSDTENLKPILRNLQKNKSALLIKGSRGIQLENVLK